MVRGAVIRRDGEDRICLNDLWRAAGQPMNKEPSDWRALPSTKGILNALNTIPRKIRGIKRYRLDYWQRWQGGRNFRLSAFSAGLR